MKTPRTKKGFNLIQLLVKKGFTLIELLVVIGIIALLASIALPAFTSVQVKAAQTKALNNAKQIGLAAKSFAIDNNGQFMTYAVTNGTTSTTELTTAQGAPAAFDQLFPTYLSTLQPFYQPTSPETPLPKAPVDPATITGTSLAIGQNTNHWAYVAGCNQTSNSSWPLITDNPNTYGSSGATWTTAPNTAGGVWKGTVAIVVHVDDSATIDKLNSNNYEDMNGPGGTDIFATSGSNWMSSSGSPFQELLPAN